MGPCFLDTAAQSVAPNRLRIFLLILSQRGSGAGFLMIREAGGEVLDLQGNHADWRGREILAGNPRLVELFLELKPQE